MKKKHKMDYYELERLRRQAEEAADWIRPDTIIGRWLRRKIAEIEDVQREIINKRFGR